uniref:Uncharacterized protein n=1 Tax=Panagrolaimus superbus TaxID=310955 RepID=A0A914Y8M7_9BILA
MQLRAYTTINGSKPTRSLVLFSFERGTVSDLCAFIAEKFFCPFGSTFSVSVKSALEPGGDPAFYKVTPDVVLEDASEMSVVVELPTSDPAAFQLSQSVSQLQLLAHLHSSQMFPGATGTAVVTETPSDDAQFLEQVTAIFSTNTSSDPDEPPEKAASYSTLLHAVYLSQRQAVDESYVAMKPANPVLLCHVMVLLFLH